MRRAFGIVTMVFATVCVLTWTPAAAHYIVGATGNVGCGEGLNIHDPTDPVIGYQRNSLTSPAFNAVDWVMVNKVIPTDLEAGPASSGGDFVYEDDPYTNLCGKDWWQPGDGGIAGTTACTALVNSACDTHKMYLSTTWMNSTTTGNIRKLVCHETGHSIGIPHNTHADASLDSCMKDPPSSAGMAGYSSHEINDMINYVW